MADNTAPHGAHLGPLFAPAFHRPWFRYVDPVDGAEATPEPTPDPTPDPEPDPIDWKAEARKHEARAKENLARAKANEDAARRLAEIEESQKSDQQKLTDQIAALSKELDGYKQRDQVSTWAAEIVKDSAVPASALRGATKEELQEHFEVLKGLVAPAPKPKATPSGKSPQERDKPTGAAAALRALRNG